MISTVQQLRAIFPHGDQIKCAVLLTLQAFMAILEAAGIASILPFMMIVTSPESVRGNEWLSKAYDLLQFQSATSFLLFIGYCVLGLMVITNVGKILLAWLTLRYQNGLVYKLSRRLLATYMARPYAFFLGRNTSELGSVLLSESQRVISGIVGPVMDIVANGLVGLTILALLLFVDPTVAVSIVFVLGCAYGAIYFLIRRRIAVLGQQQVENSWGKYRSATEALSGIKDLKILGREISFLDAFKWYSSRHARSNVLVGIMTQLPRHFLEILAFGGILLVVLYLIRRGEGAAGIVPMLALYAFAGYRLLPASQALFGAATQLRFSDAALNLVHDELRGVSAAPMDPEAHLRDIANAKEMSFSRALTLNDVAFRYSGASDYALNNLNLTIQCHTSVGIVGPTGCGKTTTIDLIIGLLVPDRGQLEVDGAAVTDTNRPGWQRLIGYVPQHIYLTDNTVAGNIAFGIPENRIDMEAVRKAAAIANLSSFIENELPEGYETYIGERGVRLSGGQRQRIGIARAMYRDPPVLVFDEATSALDGLTEEQVMDALRRLSGKKTVILIAHRLTTVRECDVIYQLEKGRVVASGSYAEMMEKSEWFRSAARGSS